MKNFQIFLFSVLLLFTACRKDEVKTGFEFEPVGGSEVVTSQLSGQVINEAGLPLPNAIVRIGNEEKTTNEDGVFSFSNMEMNADGEMITIEKSGFFTNVKRVVPIKGNTFQRIGLVTKSAPTGMFDATQGGTISKPNGEKIVFQANTIVDESGNDYTGEVTVYTHHFNPENPFLGEMMPGDLSGINAEGKRVKLATYSMILAELYGASGQKLNLKSGTTAAVEFPIKGTAAANAPAEIPLWSLDELTGVWVEERRAIRDGNYYKADVTHFSFWDCCEAYFDLVNLEGQVLDRNGVPVVNTTISLEIVNPDILRFSNATTNGEGRFRGGVPMNEEMILTIWNQCGILVYSENIGPYTADEQISITVVSAAGLFVLSGSLKDCNNDPVTEGYVVAVSDLGSKYILPIDSNGEFNVSLPICQRSELSVYGVDETSLMQSPEVVFNYTGQLSEVIGDLQACDVLDEFIALTFEGDTRIITEADVIFEPELLRIQVNLEPRGVLSFNMDIKNPQLGINTPESIRTGNEEANLAYSCHNSSPIGGPPPTPCTGNVTVEITKFDKFIGGFIEGKIEGQLWTDAGILEDVSIEFKVKIDFKLIEIGGRVWDDLNKDGIQDLGEPGIPDFTFHSEVFFNAPAAVNGKYIYGITTDADGYYTTLMTLDKPGNLAMWSIPSGYIITQQAQGSVRTKDSDFDPSTNSVENVIAIEGGVNQFDCGLYLE